jgi:capsular polysaccharide transport system permease protein
MNQLKAFTPLRLLVALVAMPIAVALLYFALFAANRYVSESTVALQQSGNDAAAAAVPGAALLLAGLNPPLREETLYRSSTSIPSVCCRHSTEN